MAETKLAGMSDVDPAIREFQRLVNRDYARFSAQAGEGVAARRLVAEKVREPWRSGGPAMARIAELRVSDIRLRIYMPQAAQPGRVLVYLHGGGWVMFSLDTHDRLMREYAARSQTVVVGVDYGLSPEAPYPRALKDVAAVLGWLREGGLSEAGLQTGDAFPAIILGGDSAGANLAIASAMWARDEGRRGADGLLLNYGAFDTAERSSHRRYDGGDYMLTRDEMAAFWRDYLGGAAPEHCAYARPLRAEAKDLPPTYMCIAECDILVDENCEMTAHLRKAGVEVVANIYAGATHSFLEAVSISTLAGQAFEDAAAWLKRFAA